MVKYKYKNIIYIGLIIIIIYSIYSFLNLSCHSTNLTNSYVTRDLVKYNKQNICVTIGVFPYYHTMYYQDELQRIANCIDVIDKYKSFSYTPDNKFKQNKISIKLSFFYTNGKLDFSKLVKLVDKAYQKNIIIGIDTMTFYDRDEEINTYLRLLNLGYYNTFLTLACYHTDIDKRVDLILKHHGSIRLVKGYYSDNTVKSWKQVSKNYLRNAKKLVKDKQFHIIATHDFDILKILYDNYQSLMDTKQVAFFEFSQTFVQKKLKTFPYNIKNKVYYRPYGRICLSFFATIKKISFSRVFQRRIIGKIL